ncbi:S-adenosylmethionine decarboxylase [Patescibacteria group bacterium]|nr:S-adenosylmethionine decarboxylase [Patescibacteria group bacterium]MBU1123512.1 S-adenosylmethionine decarboxylase [Patescibacteria group bacterium]MBU1910878.1 S-adenosylmethionine decarboxylase [Patescibacteria group bacterium]
MVLPSRHFSLQHEILLVDAYLKDVLKNRESLMENFLNELLTALRMEELGPLQIFDAADLRAPGWSFLQPITTSHISGHYFIKPEKHPSIHMDIYSCASVNWRKAIEIIDKYFQLGEWRGSFIDRRIDDGKRIIWDLNGEGAEVLEEQQIVFEDEVEIPIEENEPSMKEIVGKKVASVYNV